MIKKLAVALAILAILTCSACSDTFDPREDAVIVDTQTVDNYCFAAFESKDEPGEMGVAVYRMTDEQQGLNGAQLDSWTMQEDMTVQGREVCIDYVFTKEAGKEAIDYLVVLCQNPKVASFHLSIDEGPVQMWEISNAPSVLSVAMPVGHEKHSMEFRDAQGNEVWPF